MVPREHKKFPEREIFPRAHKNTILSGSRTKNHKNFGTMSTMIDLFSWRARVTSFAKKK
jgi:hypothetical protein